MIDDPVRLRSEILRHTGNRFQKVAMIIGRVLLSPGIEVTNDRAIADIVVDMVAKGELIAVGDPHDMRFSEVKLP